MKMSRVFSLAIAFFLLITLTIPFADASNVSERNTTTPRSALCAECGEGEVYLASQRQVVFQFLASCPAVSGATHTIMIDGIHYFCRLCESYNGSQTIYRYKVECSAGIEH